MANPESTHKTGTENGRPFGRGFTLGRIFQVQVQVDWTLLIIFALITFNLGALTLRLWHPDWSAIVTWAVALGAALLFFASVLIHELSHALVARTQGIAVKKITLFLFGGLAHMESEPESPKAEFLMAIVGPITSILIGVIATVIGVALAGPAMDLARTAETTEDLQAAFRGIGPWATLFLWLGPINLLLGIFNVLPGFPLDGGRVFRAIVWRLTGDLVKATRWAAGAGHVLAWTLIALGVMNMFSGALAQGLWLVLIGWFLNNAARMSYEQLVVRNLLADVPVAEVMRTQLLRVRPELDLDAFTREYVMASDQNAFPVEKDGELLGLADIKSVRGVPHEKWSTTTIGDVMTPAKDLPTLAPDASAESVLAELARSNVDQVAVLKDSALQGLVQRDDLLKWIALQGRAQQGAHA